MMNNIGLPGILLLLLVFVLPIFLIVRSGRRRAETQQRIAEALEEIAKKEKSGS